MEERRYGECVTLECRHDSHEEIIPTKEQRYRQIIDCLKETPQQTAKEISMMMWQKGYSSTGERNVAAPRLTELSIKGIVEPIGKKVCGYTGKKVTVYSLRNEC
jgi:uncharacterized protein YneF (UPF0154 family)